MSSIQDQITRTQGGAKLTVPIVSPNIAKETEFNFRALPYKHAEGNNPFIESHVHSNLGKEQKDFAMCPEKMLGEDCPYCATAKVLKDRLDADDWKKIAKKFYPQSSVYIPGIVRYAKYSEFSFLKVSAYQNFQQQIIGILTSKQLKKLFKMSEETAFIEIWNIKQGLDFVVTLNAKSKERKYPTFTIASELELTCAHRSEEEKLIIVEYLKDTPNIVDEMIQIWGCREKINGIFVKQHPSHAVKLGLISEAEVSETPPEEIKNSEAKEEDAMLPKSTSPSTDAEIDNLINANDSEQSEDSTSDVKSDDSASADEEYNKLMADLDK